MVAFAEVPDEEVFAPRDQQLSVFNWRTPELLLASGHARGIQCLVIIGTEIA